MLQLKTIDTNTFSLLKDLSAAKYLSDFALAGGTSLALQLGHRISVDLDFFTLKEFSAEMLVNQIKQVYKVFDVSINKNALTLNVEYNRNIIKIDCIRHNYNLIEDIKTIDKIRVFSVSDIAAMKLNAIINRGAKKDFYDIFELLQHYSLKALINFFTIKYPEVNIVTLIKSLEYFEDAELDPSPISLKNISWEEIKRNILIQVKKFVLSE